MIPSFLKNKLLKNRTSKAQANSEASKSSAATTYTNAPINQLYRKISGQALDVAVKAKLLGELPVFDNDDQTLTFYVLQDYSRSNSILIDLQTGEHKLPPALMSVKDSIHDVNENAGIIFLHHPKAKDNQLSPRLSRLVAAILQHPDLQIRLVPVSILWGRAPEKEDSLFKLLMADNWQDPSITKQLFNIGVMGRDTFVQFHAPKDLRTIIYNRLHDESSDKLGVADTADSRDGRHALVPVADANRELVRDLQQELHTYLDNQRTTMLGPDLSDRRNLVDKLIYSPAIQHATQIEADEKDISVREARGLARNYANEMVNDYSHSIIRVFDKFLTWLWTQLYDGVDVHHFERVRELATDHEIIYVPCHRSH
ncbi:glycerol-3-phosphate 1-O-acyltransferase PlsB, partial [Psychrobacter sp. 1U2]